MENWLLLLEQIAVGALVVMEEFAMVGVLVEQFAVANLAVMNDFCCGYC